MAAPATVTFTMTDSGPTTVAQTIPSNLTASQLVRSVQVAGGLWSTATPDTVAGATFWPWGSVLKAVTS